MFFSSAGEFALVALFIVVTLLIRRSLQGSVLQVWLALGNVVLLSTLLTPASIIVHAFLSVAVFFYGKYLKSNPSKKMLWMGILALIFLFVIRNYRTPLHADQFELFDGPNGLISRLGISYILFRHIQYLVDSKKGVRHFGNVLTYFNFIIFFPNFLAGPIDKFNNFSRWFHRPNKKLLKALYLPGLGRIGVGLIKKYGIVPLFYLEATNYEVLSADIGYGLGILFSLSLYSIYIYLDFSGYSDIAIGSGYLLGVKTPENFSNPYLARNISDFWKRWHMTFSLFLRENIFMPFVKALSKAFPKAPRLSVSIFGYLFTFGLCGIWHGETVNFLYWGLWHGVGLILFKVWTLYFWKDRSKNWVGAKSYLTNGASILVNFLFVTYGWLFFHYKGESLSEIVYHITGMHL